MTFTLGHANIEQPDPLSHQLNTVKEVRDHCDLATWNEAMDTAGALKAMSGWETRTTGGLAISWKVDRFDLIGAGSSRVMTGGKHKGRRLGPNRYVLYVLLRERATGRALILATHHSIAKADTDNKWRRSFRSAGWRNVVSVLREVKKRHSGIPLILTGDMNTIRGITAFVSLGVREVKTPATFGKRLRYDRIFATTSVSNVHTLTTKSDHKALLSTVTLGPAVDPEPEPEVPAPPVEEPEVATSQNGYVANDRSRIETITIPGTSRRIALRRGAPGQLLAHFAAWFDKNIESVDGGQLDDWGYAERPIRGSRNTLSNHASGTAIDINAPRHPLGRRGTFTPGQASRIRAKLKEYDGAIRWGGDYKNRADEMHFEIMASPERCASILKRLNVEAETPKPKPPNHVQEGRRLIREGLAELRKAPDTRKAVHERADQIEAIYKKGPSS